METAQIALKKKAALISLIIGFLMFFGKMGAYVLTGSAAVLSDALESVVHIFATSFAFYSLHLATKPPDLEHPYGHGKVEFFSAGFEGALIIIAAISIIFYAVRDIIVGREISSLDSGAAIITVASVVNLLLGLYLIRTGKRTKSIVLIADGKHVLTDSITSFGAVAALILVLITDITLFDPIIAIILALNILWTGKDLLKESVGGLMNETDKTIIESIAAVLESERNTHPNWIDVHRLRYWKSGDTFMVDFHLIVPYYQSVSESHDSFHRLEAVAKKELDTGKVELFVHLDPCNPRCCFLCNMPECKVRKEPATQNIIWDGKKIIALPSYDIDQII
ncbi:MAG: cation diffusion facilitator family transporter [Ignavibacteria bacterium]|nr:cation diffusion facilitator family transporter [Ignavibacteria bacterium]